MHSNVRPTHPRIACQRRVAASLRPWVRNLCSLLTVCALLLAGACDDKRLVSPAQSGPAPAVGDVAPALAVTQLDGKRFDLAAQRGKVVLVDLWATWCGPCKESMPELEALHQELGAQGLVVIGVSLDDEPDGIADFVSATGVTFAIAHDQDRAVNRAWSPPRMPTSWLIDRDGKVAYVHPGFRTGDEREIAAKARELVKGGL